MNTRKMPGIIRLPVVAMTAAVLSASLANGVSAQTFTDVAAAAGLIGGAGSWAGAWADFDGDGDLDVMTIGHLQPALGGKNQLWRNNGDGTFTDVSADVGLVSDKIDTHGAIWADFDRDGDLDVYLQNESIQERPQLFHELWRNNGDGTFTDVATEAGIIAENYITRGTGAADYDRDGLIDIFGVVWENPRPVLPDFQFELSNLLWHNDGNLTFTNRATEAGVSMQEDGERRTVSWTDFNNDGHPDLIVMPPCELYRNEGNGTFTDVTDNAGILRSDTCQGAGWADYDGDGFVDLYTSRGFNLPEDDILYRNNGDGTFTNVSEAAGISGPTLDRGVTWGDYDNDGHPDLYVVNFNNNTTPNSLYRNNGDGTFTDVAVAEGAAAQVAGGGAHGGFVDYNGDGALDIFVTNGEGTTKGPYTLLHNAGNDNNWLKLKLVGRTSNPDAIMTRATVESAGGSQMQIHTGSAAWMSQSSMPMHFGLGSDTGVTQLVLNWPSGTVQTVKNIAADQTVTLVEGRAVWAEAPTVSAPGFYLWQGASGSAWKMVWKGDGTTRQYTGQITITDGTFTNAAPVRLETGDAVTWTTTSVNFATSERSGVDGVDFFVRGQRAQITVDLKIDGVSAPGSVFLGKYLVRPATLPLVVSR